MKIKQVILMLLTFIMFSCQPKAQSDKIDVVGVEEFSQVIQQPDVQLLDVRTVREYEAGHIDQAINIDVLQESNFKNEIQKLDKTKPVAVYCKSGKRSNKAAHILEDAGFLQITDLDGGYTAWEKR